MESKKLMFAEHPGPSTLLERAAEAEAAGFTAAAETLRTKADRMSRLHRAYHYRFVSQEVFDKFNQKLKDKTSRPATAADAKKIANGTAYYTATILHDQLTLVALEKYPALPPAEALKATTAARETGIFHRFEVAEVNPVGTEIKLPDPIVFGLVDGCTDRFFVCEWGSDVSIKDLLGDA